MFDSQMTTSAPYKVCLAPNDCEKVCKYLAKLHNNDGWSITSELLAINHPCFATVRNSNGEILGTASASYVNQTNAWIANVYVQKQYRKNGLGSLLIKEVCKFVRESKYCKVSTLLSLSSAVSFYKRSGFSIINSVSGIAYETKIDDIKLIPTPHSEIIETEEQHQSAMKFFSQITKMERNFVLENILLVNGVCATTTQNGEIVAAAWGRRSGNMDQPNHELSLAPVVGKSVQFAKEACSKLIQHECDYRRSIGLENVPFLVNLNVLDKKSDHSAKNICEDFEMKYYDTLTYMALPTCPNTIVDEDELDLMKCNTGYYGLLGWSLG